MISSDCHAGLPPERYRDYLDPKYHAAFDAALPIQIEMTKAAEKRFLVADINDGVAPRPRARRSRARGTTTRALRVLDGDGIAGEILFPDGITEMNMPPFGAGLSLPTENVVPELQWAGARAHNRWMAEFWRWRPSGAPASRSCRSSGTSRTRCAEIRWAREHGLRGRSCPVQWGKRPPYHHPKYDPIWAVCEELGLSIHFHSGPAPIEDYFGGPPQPGQPDLPARWASTSPRW